MVSPGGEIVRLQLNDGSPDGSVDLPAAERARKVLARDRQRQAHDVGPKLFLGRQHPFARDGLLGDG